MRIVFDANKLAGNEYFDKFIEKARKGEQVGGEYIYRENIGENVRTSNGKTVVRRYRYYYIKDMLKDSAEKILSNIGNFFFKGNKEEIAKIEKAYESENIQKNYGADKKTWYEHVMEYFSHRALWDKRFSNKDTAEKWKKPVKTIATDKLDVKGMETPADKAPAIQSETEKAKEKKAETKKWKANPSLMRKVWSLYTGKQEAKEEKQKETAEKVIAEKENEKKPKNVQPLEFSMNRIFNNWVAKNTSEKEKGITYKIIKTGRTYQSQMLKNGEVWGSHNFTNLGDAKEWCAEQNIEGAKRVETEAEEHANRSEAMKGNQNAKKLFADFVDSFIASGYKSDKTVNLLNSTPSILVEHGIPDNPISITPKILEKILTDESNIYHGHNIAADIVKDLPNQLENPVYILKGKDNKKIIVTEHFVEDRPIISILEINRAQGRTTVNSVRSLYDKKKDIFLEWIKNPENVEYENQEKSKVLLQSIGNQYSEEATTPYTDNNTTTVQNVNENPKNNDIISGRGAKENEKDNTGTEPAGLSERAENLRGGRSEGAGNQHADGAENGDNGNESLFSTDESGNGPGISDSGVNAGRGRITKGQAREIRRQCREILEKPDSAITEADKAVLSQYVGAGGTGEDDSSNSGTLYEFYTPRNVISKVWEIVDKYNSNQEKSVIEPSSGTGRFAEGRKEKFTLFELEEESARIAHILHPDAEVVQGAFQENFMKNKGGRFSKKFKPYDVAVGNPPYGAYTGKYKGLGEGKEYKRYETYFMSRTLDTLKDGGVMAMVVPSGFMDGKSSYGKDLEKIAGKGELLEAWRLPNGTFDSTDVGTDIVVFRKGKGGSVEQIKSYFEKNPDHIAGEVATRTNRFGKEEKYIKPKSGQTFESAVENIDAGASENIQQKKELASTIKATEKKETKDAQKITSKTKFGDYVKTEKGNGKVNGYIKNKSKTIGVCVRTDNGEQVDCLFDKKETDAEKHENRSRAMKNNKNAEGEHDYPLNPNAHKMSVEEFNKKYAKNFDAKDMPAWKATDKFGHVDMTKLSDKEREYVEKSDHFVKEGGMYMNVVNYASGNIREKLSSLDKNDSQYELKKSLLEAVCPKEKKIGEFTLSPITDWAREYKTADGKSLIDGFFDWAYNGHGYYSASDSPVAREEIPPDLSFSDIKDFISKKPYSMSRAESRDYDDKKELARVKDNRKQLRRNTAIKLFNRYLQEGLALDEQKRLTETWNLKANSLVNPDFSKMPVFVDGMSTHKGSKDFTLMDQQMKGISMLINKGTGLLAYDVGVGKTACGIVATVNQIQTGRSKKPLICVPKAVYSNWIESIHEFFPDMKVNELGNLSKNYWKEGMKIEPGTISVCTYEGLENIGFNESEEEELKQDIEFAEYTEDGNKKTTKRQQASKDEKLNEKLGEMSRTRDEGVQFSDLGFDHITVDEVHNFRNLFKMPRHINKNKDEDDELQSNEFNGLGAGGEPSNRAKKLFAITQLIQRHNEGRNTFLLSATPFQNSPTEIYSILSYMARDKLRQMGFYSLEQFVSNFCKVQNEYVVKANRVTQAPVVKGFENLSELQNLLTAYMDKVDGEEAGVVRPYKRMHAPELELSDVQKDIMDNISSYIEKQEKMSKKERDDGYMFRAMNAMKNCALSPELVTDSEFMSNKKISGFVESSPKLKFVCDSIIAQYKKNSHNGQIMYMPLGVEQFPKVKDYLVKHGMPKDAIATISGGATTDKAMDARDAIFKDFNDVDGKCKVIIGSSTIKEGCNLQGNTTTIYCTQLDWNPTDVQQLWGRGWRQGNRQGIVHCVTPLMHDSLDPMIYQKHDEKGSRTNDIYSYKGDRMNPQDVNPEELKFALIKDPAKRADLQVMEYAEKNKSDEKMYGQMIDVLHKQIDAAFESDEKLAEKAEKATLPYSYKIKNIENELETGKKNLGDVKKVISSLTKKYKGKEDKWRSDFETIREEVDNMHLYGLYTNSSINYSFENFLAKLEELEERLYPGIIAQSSSYLRMYNKELSKAQKTRDATKKYLESRGMFTKGDCEQKIQDYLNLMNLAKENAGKEEEMRAEFYKKAVADNAANEKNLLSVSELVKQNVDSIMNDLHPMDAEWKAKIKAENEKRFAKSLPMFFIMNGRFYINKNVRIKI